MFENMCKGLKIVLGSGPGANKIDTNAAIKMEQSSLPSEEVLYAVGYHRRGGGQGYRGGGGGRGSGRGVFVGHASQSHVGGKFGHSREQNNPYERSKGKMNRPDDEGNPTNCHHCGSKLHFLNKCPDREESVKVVTHDEEAESILYSSQMLKLSSVSSHRKLSTVQPLIHAAPAQCQERNGWTFIRIPLIRSEERKSRDLSRATRFLNSVIMEDYPRKENT